MYNAHSQPGMYEHPIRPKLTSSVSSQNSDDDNDTTHILIRRDRRRELHTQAEQRRRDAIKSGYEALLPLCHPTSSDNGSSKLSKATILQRAISQIKSLSDHTAQKEKELENLKNELFALRIMNSDYEEMAKGNKNQMRTEEVSEVPEHVKFEIFGQFMLALFQSFDKGTKFDNFTTASSTIIHWVEEYCKPQNLNILVESVLTDVLSEYHDNQTYTMTVDPSITSCNMKMDQDSGPSFPLPSSSSSSSSVSQTQLKSLRSLPKTELRQTIQSEPFYEFCEADFKRFPSNIRRQTMPTLPSMHSQTHGNAMSSVLDVPIDDELMSMSPNAIDLSFLDSLDQENLIDDMWLPSDKTGY